MTALATTLDISLSPAAVMARRRNRRQLVVLAYHHVRHPAAFQDQLAHLVAHYQPVDLGTVLDGLNEPRRMPDNAVLVTFDDGDRSLLEVGLPLLRAQGIPAVAFVIAGLVGTREAPWWVEVQQLAARTGLADPEAEVRRLKHVADDERIRVLHDLRDQAGDRVHVEQLQPEELRALEAGGVAIGNHSWSHPLLDRCPTAKVEEEVGRAHARLEEILGHRPTAIAYPNGNVDDRAVGVARRLGYQVGFLFDHRTCPIPPPDPLRMSRIRANDHDTRQRFRLLASGVHSEVHHLLGRP